MAGLLDLAPEILRMIIQNLPPEWASSMDTDLYRVARTCRRLFDITEPLLYTKFIQGDSQQTFAFLRTILQKPGYAARVKIVFGRIRSDDDSDEDASKDTDADGCDDLQLLCIKACETYNLPSDDCLTHKQWITALQARNPEALFALAVLLLPNLKSIDMTSEGYHDGLRAAFFSQAINTATQSSVASLKTLEELTHGPEDPQGHISVEEILPFFYLPSLRKVEVSNLSAEDIAWEKPLTSSNIEEMSFIGSGISDDAWPILLSPMCHLKYLQYSPGNPEDVGYMANTPEGLGIGLACVQDTLESLDVCAYWLGYDDTVLGSFREFPKLKEINVQIELLTGTKKTKAEQELWEMLPSVLENITFSSANGGFRGNGEHNRLDTIEQVVDVVLRKESYFPALKNIYMHNFEWLDLKPLEKICIARGVGLNKY